MEFVLEQYAGILNLEHENTRTRVFLHTHSRNSKRTGELITSMGYLIIIPRAHVECEMLRTSLAVNISYPTSASGITVSLKSPQSIEN